MDTFLEMQTAVQSDSNVSSNSSLFPLTKIKSTIQRAYIKSGSLFRWPALEDAKKTSTGINQEYYDSPQGWRPDSIWRLEVNGELYGEEPDGSPTDYNDYLTWRLANPNSRDKKWGVQWMRYFITPVPTAVIANGISIWGQMNVNTLVENADTTIFSYNLPECNDAIVLETVAMLKKKAEDANTGQMLSAEAKQILAFAFNKIKQEKAKYEKIQPFLNVPDYFSGKGIKSSKNTIGNFVL